MFKDTSSHYQIRFLTNDLSVVDGRPVFSPDGEHIVFMRQPNNGDPGAPSSLYIMSTDNDKPRQLKTIDPVFGKLNATRPDYSWTRTKFEIAFDAVGQGIWLLDLETSRVKQVLPDTIDTTVYTWSYPSWYPDGKHLSVTNYNMYGNPLWHSLIKLNIKSGEWAPTTDNSKIWPGQSSVSQTKSKFVAFAGQKPVTSCNCPQGCDADGYAQDCNQIWITDTKDKHLYQIDQQQGRAPWFSPDGQYIVFESNRANPSAPDRYRLFIYSVNKKTLKVVTSPALNVQHAKWSPDSKRLVFAVELFGGAQGIALLDLCVS
jgi:Tol biopolymer transport system component